MAAPSCLRCGGRRWVRYFSETSDGGFEEAFRLCPCNHSRPEAERGAGYYCEEPTWARNISREKPTSRRIGVIELRVELWCSRPLKWPCGIAPKFGFRGNFGAT
jgi:hypothetical protein